MTSSICIKVDYICTNVAGDREKSPEKVFFFNSADFNDNIDVTGIQMRYRELGTFLNPPFLSGENTLLKKKKKKERFHFSWGFNFAKVCD